MRLACDCVRRRNRYPFRMRILCLALAFGFCLAPPAPAQDRLGPRDVTDLAAMAHLQRGAMSDRLRAIVPGFRLRASRPLDIPGDPFLWVLNAAFGAPGERLPAGLIHCVRFGLATRDLLTSHSASDPAVFPIFTTLRVEADDAEVWPEDAVALMRCSFAWDDARRIAPWSEAEAATIVHPGSDDGFATVTRRDDAMIQAESGRHIRPQFGEDGFRLTGRDGPRGGHYWFESLTVSRQITHQRVALRVFLLGGGM